MRSRDFRYQHLANSTAGQRAHNSIGKNGRHEMKACGCLILMSMRANVSPRPSCEAMSSHQAGRSKASPRPLEIAAANL